MFIGKIFFLGSEQIEMTNTYGTTLNLTWISIVSSVFSVIAIFVGSGWTVNSIQKETNLYVANLVFIPLFSYRMFAWMSIITLLHSFSLAVFAGFAFINLFIFVFFQVPVVNNLPEVGSVEMGCQSDVETNSEVKQGETSQSEVQVIKKGRFEIEPLSHSILSIIFPVSLLPTSELNNNNSLNLLFWLVLIGNLTLFAVLALLFVLYNNDVYNPWCNKVPTKLQLPESLMINIHFLLMSILSMATLPVMICFAIKSFR
jgi:hypothetical protein